MVLRMVEAAASTNAAALTDSFADIVDGTTLVAFQLDLANPNPNLRYRLETKYEVNSTGATDAVQTRFSVNHGAGYNALTPQNSLILNASTTIEAWNIIPLTLGSALSQPVTAGQALMSVRVQAKTTTAARGTLTNGGAGPSFWLRLVETT